MRKLKACIFILSALVLALSLCLGACTPEAEVPESPEAPKPTTPTEPTKPTESAKSVELTLADMFPAGSVQNDSLVAWMDKVQADSYGRLTIRNYPGASLVGAGETWDAVVKGVADIGSAFRYGIGGKDISERIGLFMVGVKDNNMTSWIFRDAYDEFPELRKESETAKLLWVSSAGPSRLHTRNKRVTTLEEFQGLELRAPGVLATNIVKAFGASPVDLTPADMVVGYQKGTVDGHLTAIDQLKTYRIGDFAKYTTMFEFYGVPGQHITMNWDTYNNLPADLKQILDDSLEYGMETMDAAWQGTDQAAIEYANKLGHEWITLTPEEYQRWTDNLAPVVQEEIDYLDEQGLPGTEVYNFTQERLEYYLSQS